MSVCYVHAVQAEAKEKELQIVVISYMVLGMSRKNISSLQPAVPNLPLVFHHADQGDLKVKQSFCLILSAR